MKPGADDEGAMPSTDLMRRSTILIVDDEPAHVVLLERLLKREGLIRLPARPETERPLFE